jgi:hypothetical protein
MSSTSSKCVYVTGFCRHETPVFRIAFAMATSLRETAKMMSLCGLPRILTRCATSFRTGL